MRNRWLAGWTSCIFLLSLLGADSAAAEIYKWKDAQGRLHFAQDLSRVPPKYRRQAESDRLEEGQGPEIQQYRAPTRSARGTAPGVFGRNKAGASGGGPAALSRGKSATAQREVHRIRVEKTGSSMRVTVRLNGSTDVPFILDTGASDVVVPAWAAKKMNLDLSKARTNYYRTANGVVESPVITLESVQLGSAKAQNVPASISKQMSVGLLGLTFFNQFRYNIDPVAGIVTLEENGLTEEGHIRGGRSESQWRYAFRHLGMRREKIEEALDEVGSSRARRKAELEAMIEEADRQMEVLEAEADEARVPMRWRD